MNKIVVPVCLFVCLRSCRLAGDCVLDRGESIESLPENVQMVDGRISESSTESDMIDSERMKLFSFLIVEYVCCKDDGRVLVEAGVGAECAVINNWFLSRIEKCAATIWLL